MTDDKLFAVVEFKAPHARPVVREGRIIAWFDGDTAQPTEAELAQWEAEFDAALPQVTAAKAAAAARRVSDDPMIGAFYLFWFRKANGRDPTDEEREADEQALVDAFIDDTARRTGAGGR